MCYTNLNSIRKYNYRQRYTHGSPTSKYVPSLSRPDPCRMPTSLRCFASFLPARPPLFPFAPPPPWIASTSDWLRYGEVGSARIERLCEYQNSAASKLNKLREARSPGPHSNINSNINSDITLPLHVIITNQH